MNNKTTKEVFEHHLKVFANKDIIGLMSDFNEDSIYINSFGIELKGVQEIIKIYQQYFEMQEKGTTSNITNMIIKGEIVFLEWTSDSPSSYIEDGVDTFVIRNGIITAQTAKFTVRKKD